MSALLRRCAKEVFFRVATGVGARAAMDFRHRHALKIVTYHGVEADCWRVVNLDRLQVEPLLFQRQVEALAQRYRIRRLGEMLATTAPDEPWPERTLCLTFDDGYLNNADVAAPILKKIGVPATFFVTHGYIDGRDYPWWYLLRAAIEDTKKRDMPAPDTGTRLPLGGPEERVRAARAWEPWLVNRPVRERDPMLADLLSTLDVEPRRPYRMMAAKDVQGLVASGHEIGTHTVRHLSFRCEPITNLHRDIEEAVRALDALAAPAMRLLAYPYGHVPSAFDEVYDILKSFRIAAAVTTQMGSNGMRVDRFRMRRLDIQGNRSAKGVCHLTAFATPA